MTKHEEFVETMRAKAKAAGRSLGPQAEAAARFRPLSYCELSVQSQWDVDKRLGLLDWSGNWDE